MLESADGGAGVDDIAGLLDAPPVAAETARPSAPSEPAADQAPDSPLHLTVVWGNLTLVPADVHVVGHYQGVVPTSVERALDEAISVPPDGTGRSLRGVIEEATRRRWLVEQLGVVSFFPVARPGPVQRPAVVAMGRVGTFNQRRATQLYESLISRVASLPDVSTVASALIGSGAGNLSIRQATTALAEGAIRARRAFTLTAGDELPLERLLIVEQDSERAELVQDELQDVAERTPRDLRVDPEVTIGPDGAVSRSAAVDRTAGALARLAYGSHDPKALEVLDMVLRQIDAAEAEGVRARLKELGAETQERRRLRSQTASGGTAPTRLSVVTDGDSLRWGAITDRATVSERILPAAPWLLDALVARLERPAEKDLSRLAEGLSRLLVPVDMQSLLDDHAPIVVEVDRSTARLQWELLADLHDVTVQHDEPLGLRTPIVRQLRTSYSRLGTGDDEDVRRVLVVGDPGDPHMGRSLPGARYEATQVAAAFQKKAASAPGWPPPRVYLGPPVLTAPDDPPPAVPPADLVEVLIELTAWKPQIVHFAGHGMHDPGDPQRRAGLLFAAGLLTSEQLMNLPQAPRLVVANACFSARVTGGGDVGSDPTGTGEAFLPTLADEFLRAGVVHFIGATWKVHDYAGAAFAEAFYAALLTPGTNVGDAMAAARRAVWDRRELFGCDWAAYQHYGDPGDVLVRD